MVFDSKKSQSLRFWMEKILQPVRFLISKNLQRVRFLENFAIKDFFESF